MEHVVIHKRGVGPVHVWRRGMEEASASAVGAYFIVTGGRDWESVPAPDGMCRRPRECVQCLAYRKHLELRDG